MAALPRSAAPVSARELVSWWGTLSTDDQELLIATSAAVPGNQAVLTWLAWLQCPLVSASETAPDEYVLGDPNQFHTFLTRD